MRKTTRLTWAAATLLLIEGCGTDSNAKDLPATPSVAPPALASTNPLAKALPTTPFHSVFDLDDNRLLAHSTRGGATLVLPGSRGFAKYLRFAKPKISWTLGKSQDGQAVAVADAYASFDVPIDASQAGLSKKLHLRLHSEKARRIGLTLAAKDVATRELKVGWQLVTFDLPAELVKVGENRFQLVSTQGGGASVAWIQLGGEASAEAPTPKVFDPATRAQIVAQGDGLSYYIQVPKAGYLKGDVSGDGCALQVTARAHGGAKAEGLLAGQGSSVDLSALAGQIVRLDLVAQGCPVVSLTEAALVVPGEAPVIEKTKRPKHVIFWIMDSLRADRMRPFWPKARPEVPVLERLSKEGTVFRNTYVQGNESRASHASIWASQYPVNHQMIRDGAKLDAAKWTTLGEAMKASGFNTSGVSANGYIIAKWGFGEGWNAYRNHIHEGGGVKGENILDYGLRSIEGKFDKPVFLYLGTIDTHVSWRAKKPWIARYSPTYDGKFKEQASGKDVELMAAGKLSITEADKAHIRAIYDSNVSYQDKLVGDLEAKLKQANVWEDTLLMVTADHGDEQWEDGKRVGHGASLKESLVRVPLYIRSPGLFPGGTVIEGAETVDILPTLLDAVGAKIPDDAQGESLIALAQGQGQGYPRPSIASQYEFAHAMRLADWKVRVGGSAVPELYDIENDPYEKNDLAQERPIERRFLTDVFSIFLVHQKKWRKTRWGVASNHAQAFADDLEK